MQGALQATSCSGRVQGPCAHAPISRATATRQAQAEQKSRRRLVTRAKKEAGNVVEKISEFVDECGENVLEFCNLDANGRPVKRSLGEKEGDFLDALRSFYYDKVPIMSNEEFDNLKEELIWSGSKVAVLSSTEQRFLEAAKSFQAGKPMLNDEEYDALKVKLQQQNSTVVKAGPRCSIRSRNMYSDATIDYLKMTALNLPAALVTLGALFGLDYASGFSVTRAVELPEPYGIVVVWGLVLPLTYLISSALTNLVLRDFLILKGDCPNCNTESTTYFGDIFTVKGPKGSAEKACGTCKAKLEFDSNKRSITVTAPPPQQPPPGEKAAKASKKPAPQPA